MVLFLISPKRKPSHFITGFEISADFKLDHHATFQVSGQIPDDSL
uniref:Uncharacterized protein n=1 Tax=Anguilla anguilla TaxID=7936 RepID=A0A0E9SE30_ANGAN